MSRVILKYERIRSCKKKEQEDGTPETGEIGMLCLQLLSDRAREGGRGAEKPKNEESLENKQTKNVDQQESKFPTW